MRLVIKFNILILLVCCLSYSIKLYSQEGFSEIVKDRHKAMTKIQAFTQKSYKQIAIKNSSENLELYAEEILINAKLFVELFPEGSDGGEASSDIWNKRDIFLEYNENFIDDIMNYKESILSKELDKILVNFNQMASNCGACHRKFKD